MSTFTNSPTTNPVHPSDEALRTRVGVALSARIWPTFPQVDPEVHRGEVRLRGRLDTESQRRHVVELMRRLPGVQRVHDELQVGAATPVASPTIIWRPQIGLAALLLAATLTVGCGEAAPQRTPVFPVEGTLTVKGQPAHGAIVVLHPKGTTEANPLSPRANVGPDGRFNVSTYDQGDGAPQGEYVVTVNWFKLIRDKGDVRVGPNVVPRKYTSKTSSDIVVQVAEGQNSVPPIKL